MYLAYRACPIVAKVPWLPRNQKEMEQVAKTYFRLCTIRWASLAATGGPATSFTALFAFLDRSEVLPISIAPFGLGLPR
jgi:hypothetical protein